MKILNIGERCRILEDAQPEGFDWSSPAKSEIRQHGILCEAQAEAIKKDVLKIIEGWNEEEFFSQLRVMLRNIQEYFEGIK
jgi:hypothetical protein